MILIYILEVQCHVRKNNYFSCCFLLLTLRKVMIENKSIDGNQSYFKGVRVILMFYFFYRLYDDGGQDGCHNNNN